MEKKINPVPRQAAGGKNNRDLEFGFDHKRIPSGKPGVRINGDPRGFKVQENGEIRGEFRHGDDGEFKGPA